MFFNPFRKLESKLDQIIAMLTTSQEDIAKLNNVRRKSLALLDQSLAIGNAPANVSLTIKGATTLMSTANDPISQFAADEEAILANVATAIQAGQAALDQKITDLQAELAAAGNLTPEQLAKLQEVKDISAKLLAQAQAIV